MLFLKASRCVTAHLFFRQVLIVLLLLHSELVVHLLAALADVFTFAQIVDVHQALSRLTFRLGQDVFDFWVVL